MSQKNYHWWQAGVIYEIYPRSFFDSNEDGVGDLNGIIEKLDYLKWLGVDALWIGPFYPSPMKDFGYDVADYTGVDPLFGTLDDFDSLLEAAHKKGFKVVIDFVPNHSSDKHPWFTESAASRDNEKSDWYLWHDGDKNGNPPNNWLSVFGGSAWEWNEKRRQFYYHAFLKEQPDLDLQNVEVRNAVFESMRFWLDRGVDGFRVDVMWHLHKDSLLRDNPVNPDYEKGKPEYDTLLPLYTSDHGHAIEIVTAMRDVMDEYKERVMIGEMYLSIHQTVAYYGPNNSGAHLPGNFTLLLLPWNARKVGVAIDECESSLSPGAWPNWVLGNHDRPRLSTRAGKEQTRVAAMVLLTLRGTPTMYYGDEIGIPDVEIPEDKMQDPQGKKTGTSRDTYRTPMQWNAEKHAGFTKGNSPWLPVHSDYESINVEAQKKDPRSLLSLYRKLLELRKNEPAFHVGDYLPLPARGDLLVYKRVYKERAFLVALNFGNADEVYTCERFEIEGTIVLDSSLQDRDDRSVKGSVYLKANQGLIIALQQE